MPSNPTVGRGRGVPARPGSAAPPRPGTPSRPGSRPGAPGAGQVYHTTPSCFLLLLCEGRLSSGASLPSETVSSGRFRKPYCLVTTRWRSLRKCSHCDTVCNFVRSLIAGCFCSLRDRRRLDRLGHQPVQPRLDKRDPRLVQPHLDSRQWCGQELPGSRRVGQELLVNLQAGRLPLAVAHHALVPSHHELQRALALLVPLLCHGHALAPLPVLFLGRELQASPPHAQALLVKVSSVHKALASHHGRAVP